jgi:hypothetical protein
MDTRYRRALVVAFGLGLLALLGYVVWPSGIDSGWPEEKFTTEKWKAQAPNTRYPLVKDLIRSRALERKSADEVEQILGSPSYRSPDGSYWLYTVQDRDSGVGGFNAVAMINVDFDGARKVDRLYLRTD